MFGVISFPALAPVDLTVMFFTSIHHLSVIREKEPRLQPQKKRKTGRKHAVSNAWLQAHYLEWEEGNRCPSYCLVRVQFWEVVRETDSLFVVQLKAPLPQRYTSAS